MKFQFFILLKTVICLLLLGPELNAQGSLVLNGGVITLSNGAKLVIDNPASNGIISNSGHIVSEAESNQVIWNIGNATGTYVVPWGNTTGNVFPLSVTTFPGAIETNGAFHFSTYNTSPTNLPLPSMVTHINNNFTGANNSLFAIDRFWIINATNYTLRPPVQLEFAYLVAEHQAPNTITGTNLQAQRFNSLANVWGDWGPFGTNLANTVGSGSSLTVLPNDFYEAWTLVDNTQPLPVELLSFSGECHSGSIEINWSTATETNNAFFNLYRSLNGIDFDLIHSQAGAINSTQFLEYSFSDYNYIPSKKNWYKLEQVDLNGTNKLFDAIEVNECNPDHLNTHVYYHNNSLVLEINDADTNPLEVTIVNKLGQIINIENWNPEISGNQLTVTAHLSSGLYFVTVFDGLFTETHKVLVN
ncbi:MAG: T9SS type A sorting domain-containing protein [Bacteroidia bacterium]|nr:T9SS type A sorting domain-containing protein [Bacteroidia bacterium]